MIINGGGRCNGGFFAKHLSNPDKNEVVKVIGFRNLAAENMAGAFREMRAVASGTRCKDYFYHANINILAHERLTPEQWEKAVDTLEKKLGLTDHARFVVEHVKNERTHQHIVWSRIDVDKMRAVNMGKDYFKHQAVARQLEKEFDLERGISVLGEGKEETRPERRPENWEVFRGQERGIDPFQLSKELTAIWKNTNNGKEFAVEIEKRGYVLAKGDRRNFVIIDPVGDVHSLARRLSNVKAAEVTTRFADLDMNTLPNVREAKEYQLGRNPQQGGGGVADEKTDAEREADRIFQSNKEEQDRITQTYKDEEDRKAKVFKEQAEQAEQQKADEKKAAEQEQEKQAKAQADRQVEQAREFEETIKRYDAFKAEQAQKAYEERRREALREGRDAAGTGDITNPHYRYGAALGKHYDIRDPYASLARSAMAEYGTFMQERQNLDRQIAKADDPKERQALELRKRIEHAEYMEITSRRIATQSEVIVGQRNTPEALKQRRQADDFQKEAVRLRKEYRELVEGRTQDGEKTGDHRAPEKAPLDEQKPLNEKPEPVKEQKTQNEQKEQAPITKEEKQLNEIRDIWQRTGSGKDFNAALKEKGYAPVHDAKGEFDFTVKQDGGARIAAITKNGYVHRLDPERMQTSPNEFSQRVKEMKNAELLPTLDNIAAAYHKGRTETAPAKPEAKVIQNKDNVQGRPEPPKSAEKPIMVEDRIPGKPKGEPQKLTDYVKSLPEKPEPRQWTRAEIRNNPAAERDHYSQLRAEENRREALKHINQNMESGKNLDKEDIRHLSRDDKKNIISKGDSHLNTIVQQYLTVERSKGLER